MSAAPPFEIDADLCVGHGRCYSLAPEAFAADDMGIGHVKESLDGAALQREPDSIVGACPEGAINLISAGQGSES